MDEGNNAFDVDFVCLVAVSEAADGTQSAHSFVEEVRASEARIKFAWRPNWISEQDVLARFESVGVFWRVFAKAEKMSVAKSIGRDV